MKLYAANVSNHEQQLWYRLVGPNGGNAAPHNIPLGTQNIVLGRDLEEDQVYTFMKQQERYGMLHMDDAAGYDRCISVLFSIDSPVPQKLINKYVNINKGILTQEGEDRRVEMALVDMDRLAKVQNGAGQTMDLSIEEEEPGTVTRQSGARPLEEGFSAPGSDMAKRGAKPMQPRNMNPRGRRR